MRSPVVAKSHLLHTDFSSVSDNPRDDFVGRLSHNDLLARKERDRKVGILFHTFDLVRIDPVLFFIKPRNFDHLIPNNEPQNANRQAL